MEKSLLTLFALLCVVMQGLWAQEPTQKGLYIVNGRKVAIK